MRFGKEQRHKAAQQEGERERRQEQNIRQCTRDPKYEKFIL